MRILTLSFLLIFNVLSQRVFAQADKSAMAKIPLRTVWQKGDAQTYELVKGALFHSTPTDSLQQETRQLVTISVKEVGTRGFVMSAQYHSPALLLTDDVKKLATSRRFVKCSPIFSTLFSAATRRRNFPTPFCSIWSA
jgi:hypothetical protein